ncbi:hypothetical protein N7492_009023 [Penicillium capsulatum]|uniref:rRNA-processing protein EFG1 n=1 Tax=Penicillium capsulatum TaxID=69766 RepID=A0A9W9LHU9_9EURO|nr:hypothetical protein N7492_009023 [Penicillium capsulatum]KAJ6106422.1 hypothetical protein N7512_009939 [Penicillium capsulatum]
MPSDSRHRSASKRKGRDGSEDAIPRKKHQRQVSGSDEEPQFEDYGSEGDNIPKPPPAKGHSASRQEKEYPSVNELKKRIRDVKRLLNKKDLSADARIVQERALSGYEQDLAEETARRDRSQMIKKYHFVRFLDRKTASKELNRLLRREKEQSLDSKQKDRLAQKIHAARVSLNYTIYYPLTEKYISLYPKSKENSGQEGTQPAPETRDQKSVEKPPVWSVVEKCMEEGTLDHLREGKLNIGVDGKPTPTREKPAAKSERKAESKSNRTLQPDSKKERLSKNHGKREKQIRKDYGRERDRLQDVPAEPAGNDSDGGFFEE